VNLFTRFAEEGGLQLEQGNGAAASTGIQAGNWMEDAAADQMEQLNAGAGSALGMLPVYPCRYRFIAHRNYVGRHHTMAN
jgi:hypothetical protein